MPAGIDLKASAFVVLFPGEYQTQNCTHIGTFSPVCFLVPQEKTHGKAGPMRRARPGRWCRLAGLDSPGGEVQCSPGQSADSWRHQTGM